jgi:DNA-binding transcriptional ArsR family regulator
MTYHTPMTAQTQNVFAALADPSRRQLVEILAKTPTRTATALTEELPITRQGIAKHLKILADANLVRTEKVGRETLYSLNPTPLAEATAWVELITAQWDRRLAALRDYLLSSTDDDE